MHHPINVSNSKTIRHPVMRLIALFAPEMEPRSIFAALCRAGTSRPPDKRACGSWGETSGGGNHDGSESSARQNQTTSVSLKKAKP